MNSLLSRLTIGVALCATGAHAAPIVLTFEGLQDMEPVGNFYLGGSGGFGSGPGPNLGVDFNANALALIDSDAGGNGNFGGEPSPDTALFFLEGTAILNLAAGFDTGLSFYYAAVNIPGFVNVYAGLNGTGALLATLDLPLTDFNGAPDPTGFFSPFFPIGVGFTGTAHSVDFGGSVDEIGFDNITFGSITPGSAVPEPGTYLLLASGVATMVLSRRRYR